MFYICLITLFIYEPSAIAASVDELATSNGVSVAVLDASDPDATALRRFSDHVYKQAGPLDDEVRDLLYDAYFGVRADGSPTWLESAGELAYVADTAALSIDRSVGSLTITEYAFAPMGLAYPAMVHLLYVENAGSSRIDELSLFSLANFHLGNDDDGDGYANDDEAIWMSGNTLLEQGNATGLVMTVVPVLNPTAFSCDQVYNTVLAGDDLDSRCGTTATKWTFDDQVGGFQWDIGPLRAGEGTWVGVVWGFSTLYDSSTSMATIQAWVGGRSAEDLLDDEGAWWAGYLSRNTPPSGMDADETAVYERSLIMLRGGQVQEIGDSNGQIVASYPANSGGSDFDHTWNITWVRDASYAIVALVEAGYTKEAAAALDFLISDANNGAYASYLGGLDYAVSVCRVYGEGDEWSDDDGAGPNIELDNFGLVLWAAGRYVEVSGDEDWLAGKADELFGGVADVLVASVEEDGAAAGLIQADSSIWERHWDGNQKHFTYTSAVAVAGLRAASELADRAGEAGRAVAYADAADTIADAIAGSLLDGGALAGSLEEKGADDLDLAAVEAFNLGALSDDDALLASLTAWETGLSVATGNGYHRNDDGDTYDNYEWPFLDLRAAEAWRRACEPEVAAALEDWVTARARDNYDLVPELYDPSTGDYAGPVPMMGFGAGAYVLAMHRRAEADAACTPGDTGDDTGDDTGPATDDSGGQETGAPGDDTGAPQDSDSAAPDSGDTADSGPGLYKIDGGCNCATGGAAPARGSWLALLLPSLLLARLRPTRS